MTKTLFTTARGNSNMLFSTITSKKSITLSPVISVNISKVIQPQHVFTVFFQLQRKQILHFDSYVSHVSVRELCVVCVILQQYKLGIFAFSRARQETLDQTKVITAVKTTTTISPENPGTTNIH